MHRIVLLTLLAILAGTPLSSAADAPDQDPWTIYIANDNCPDYTWGLTEEQTRQAFADIVKGHLDEMRRTLWEPLDNGALARIASSVSSRVRCMVFPLSLLIVVRLPTIVPPGRAPGVPASIPVETPGSCPVGVRPCGARGRIPGPARRFVVPASAGR